MLIVDYSLTLGLICFHGIRERVLCMTRSLHILLCLMALLNGSGVSNDCGFECCSDASGVHSCDCAAEECRATSLLTTSSEGPCDRQCCGTLDGLSLLNGAGVDESLEGVASFFVADRRSPLADVVSHVMPSSQPQSLVKTHLLVCVFLC